MRQIREEWWATTKVMPRGFRETQEVTQIAFQEELHDHVVPATNMIRVETYAVEDA